MTQSRERQTGATQFTPDEYTTLCIMAINNMLKEDDKTVIKSLKKLAKLHNEQEPTESLQAYMADSIIMNFNAHKAWEAVPQWTRSRMQFFYSAYPEIRDAIVHVFAGIGETIEPEEENAA